MTNDAVIIEVEFQLESDYQPLGHFVCLRFIDNYPQKTKLTSFIKDLNQYPDVELIQAQIFENLLQNQLGLMICF